MKRPTFFEGAGVALGASVVGGVLFSVLTALFAGGLVVRALVAVMGLVYVLYLLRRSNERVGRITTVAMWVIAATGIWLSGLSLALYVMAHLGVLWLIRSLYFHSSLIAALADLGLVALGFAAAVWAALETGHWFAGVWCFFLVQALFVFIPGSLGRQSKTGAACADAEDRFQHAHRVAEAAVGRLSTTQ